MGSQFGGAFNTNPEDMNHGTGPLSPDHRDYDLIKTHKFAGSFKPPAFPEEYNTDPKLWCPDQSAYEPIFQNPPQPFGCTNYSQAEISADIDGVLKNPLTLDNVTHANANGGKDIRQSLLAARGLGWITWFFKVEPHRPLDAFDSIRYAMLCGGTEKRSVTIGTPWYEEFEGGIRNQDGTYTLQELVDPILPAPYFVDPMTIPWHNHVIVGWKTINGSPYLVSKSWQGELYGDKGYVYFSRSLTNSLMAIPGTCAFVGTKSGDQSFIDDYMQRINLPFYKRIYSYLDLIMQSIISSLS